MRKDEPFYESGYQFHMFYALSAPGIDGMEVAVAGLDDAGIGVLRDGAVLKRHPMVPVQTVIRAKDAQGRACTFLLVGLYGPVVTDEGILEGE